MDFLQVERRQTLDQFLLVDYSCTPEEVQQHFQSCGTVNRVTILTDKFGQPKGFAYVEFLEIEAVQNAISLSESELHNRPLKVMFVKGRLFGSGVIFLYASVRTCLKWKVAETCRHVTAKRTNVPGMKAFRGGRYAPFYGYRPRRPYLPRYGKVPRFRRPMRYRPYY